MKNTGMPTVGFSWPVALNLFNGWNLVKLTLLRDISYYSTILIF